MKHKKMIWLFFFAGLLVLPLVFTHVASAAVVLKAGATWEEPLLWNDGLKIFMDMVAKESKGELNIKFVGGAETFPMFEGVEMLRKGVVDIFNSAPPFYTASLPAAFIFNLTQITPEEERKTGFYDAMNKIHQEGVNAVYLGRVSKYQYIFVFKTPVEKPDFTGLKIRGLPVFNHLIKALGGSPIVVAPPELYGALEKGMVDGYGWPEVGHIERKVHEVAKYHIDHPYYRVPVNLMMNLDAWKKLPPHLQKLIKDLMPKVEREAVARNSDFIKKEREELIKQGVKYIRWSPAEEKKFYEVAQKTGIAEANRLSPKHAPELIKLITK